MINKIAENLKSRENEKCKKKSSKKANNKQLVINIMKK